MRKLEHSRRARRALQFVSRFNSAAKSLINRMEHLGLLFRARIGTYSA